ncbi:MAG: LysR family transcriptional regulator [Kordiimonadales bacterium]|nr:MAG: LysR family transcriptional regulator [Kordiimonadales bacterium]
MSLFDDMGVFIRVMEKGSFSAAGRALRMSPALVSSRMARLENHLGIRLFVRTTRSMNATEAGKRYYEDCLDITRRVDEAQSRIVEEAQSPRGVLKLTSSTSFGKQFLNAMIADFSEAYPDIQLQYRMTDQLVDMLADGMDIAVRSGPLVDSSLKARMLAPCPRYIFAAPSYLKQHGVPSDPHELTAHNCLLLRFPGSRQFRWQFTGTEGAYDLAVHGNLDSNNGDVLTDWAVAGRGLVLKAYWEVAEEVKAGKLKAVLTDYMPGDSYLTALFPYGRHMPPRIRVFIDYLSAALKNDKRFSADLPKISIL